MITAKGKLNLCYIDQKVHEVFQGFGSFGFTLFYGSQWNHSLHTKVCISVLYFGRYRGNVFEFPRKGFCFTQSITGKRSIVDLLRAQHVFKNCTMQNSFHSHFLVQTHWPYLMCKLNILQQRTVQSRVHVLVWLFFHQYDGAPSGQFIR